MTFGHGRLTLVITVLEQRRNQRFDLRLPFQLAGSKGRSKAAGETKNVSSCGVLFTASSSVQVGEAIEYVITLPRVAGTRSDVRLHCVGKVVRGTDDLAYAATMDRYEFVRGKP